MKQVSIIHWRSSAVRSRWPRRPRGFTLVEMMVGLLLGLITTLIVAQVLVNSEGQRRNASSGVDAQVNGALALYTLQRDVQMAGYGFSPFPSALGCTVKGKFGATAITDFTLAPVLITTGANGGPDTLKILASAKTSFAVPMYVTEDHPATTVDYFVVSSALGAAVGDLMLAAPGTYDATHWCSLFMVTSSGATPQETLGANYIPHEFGSGASWNHSGTDVFPAAGYPAGSYVMNLGTMVNRTYAVGTQGLQAATLTSSGATTTTTDVSGQVVSLKALYGKDTDADGRVDTFDATTPASAAEWQQVLAVRLAIVARSGQYEKEVVTANNPVWDVGSTGTSGLTGATTCNSTSKCITIKLGDNTDTTWQHYRYKVYDTVIPLRNMIWNL